MWTVLKALYSEMEQERGKEAYKYVLGSRNVSGKDKGRSSRSSNGHSFEKLL